MRAIPDHREKLLSFLAPAVISFALGMWCLDRQGTMWRDESVTYQISHRSPSEIWKVLNNIDAVHGLYYYFMHALFSVWEGGLFALRLPSVLAISLAAGLVGLTVFRVIGTRAGLLSGIAFSVTPEVQMYAQEGRSYAMVCAAIALSTYLLVRSLESPSQPLWIAYTASILTASWLHELAILSLLAHGITILLSGLTPKVRRSWGLAAAFSIAGLAPLIALSMAQSAQVSWISGPKFREWLEISGITILAVICAKYLSGRTGLLPLVRIALPLALAPTATLLLAALHEPMYVDRYVLYVNVGLSMLVGVTLDRLLTSITRFRMIQNQKIHFGVILAVTAGWVMAILPVTLQMRTPDSRKDNVTAIADTVERISNKGDAIIFSPARRREWKLSYPGKFTGLTDLALKRSPIASASLEGEESSAGQIRMRMLSVKRIVVLSDPPGQPEDAIKQEEIKREILRKYFQECSRTKEKGGQVTLYARSGSCESSS